MGSSYTCTMLTEFRAAVNGGSAGSIVKWAKGLNNNSVWLHRSLPWAYYRFVGYNTCVYWRWPGGLRCIMWKCIIVHWWAGGWVWTVLSATPTFTTLYTQINYKSGSICEMHHTGWCFDTLFVFDVDSTKWPNRVSSLA